MTPDPTDAATILKNANDGEMIQIHVEPTPMVLLSQGMKLGMGPEQLGQLMGLDERLLRAQAEAAFNHAMNRAQARMPLVVKDAVNKFTDSRYARLEAVIRECKPVYTEAGFSISFGEGTSDKPEHIRVVATVHHAAGLTREYHADFPADTAGMKGATNKSSVQAVGSTFSYARRYLTLLIFNVAVADQDNDGNAIGDTINGAQIAEVNALIEEVRKLGKPFDFKRFLEWAGVERLDLLPQRELGRITYELKRRVREAAKEKGEQK